MSGWLIWIAFFGGIQVLGWLFYWGFEKPRFAGTHKT
jgi:hypothetical protein